MKHKTIGLIREFFGASLAEMKALTPEDRAQLASAIARARGIDSADCEFAFVEY